MDSTLFAEAMGRYLYIQSDPTIGSQIKINEVQVRGKGNIFT